MALLDYMEASKLLGRYGMHSIESRYVGSAADAVRFSDGKPIVLKVLSGKALHKSKAGLVRLNLSGRNEIEAAYRELRRKAQPLKPYKIIAQAMSSNGVEIIIGGRDDPQFGKVVLIGLGGIYVDLFRDFAMGIAPLTRRDASGMLNQLKSRQIITDEGRNSAELESLLLRVSRLLQDNGSIKELDLNPVIITKSGYQIVDIRILK
ncbi:MAG: acetate--CoA ligase family protein [Candidatus Marsarchaeota archaeon]|jgi:Acyl-CoA synthetase (NDP forming)|nr:acetate--CoA ligase family protein [Candidatus Marsarchaeota archaeon]